MLCDAIYEFWATGPDFTSLHEVIQAETRSRWEDYMEASFRFSIHGYQGKRTNQQQKDIINGFSYMAFRGPIKMRGADHEFCVHEEYEMGSTEPKRIYFGRFIANSSRSIVAKYDLKKRKYINTTSMDAELTLITANMALAAPGRFCYDPFNGTGSLPVACAHFGAVVMGSDIDGRSIRGNKGRNVLSNFAQYALSSHWIDGFAADLTNTPLRQDRYLDAIVADPPYGIREGLKVLGMKGGNPEQEVIIGGRPAHLHADYVPPKKPYSFEAMLDDILEFAVTMLVDDGRLCMWMPVANDEEVIIPIPTHPYLELRYESIQVFNKWSRRLLTYVRRKGEDVDPAVTISRTLERMAMGTSADALNPFRRKYFEPAKEREVSESKKMGRQNAINFRKDAEVNKDERRLVGEVDEPPMQSSQ